MYNIPAAAELRDKRCFILSPINTLILALLCSTLNGVCVGTVIFSTAITTNNNNNNNNKHNAISYISIIPVVTPIPSYQSTKCVTVLVERFLVSLVQTLFLFIKICFVHDIRPISYILLLIWFSATC